MLILERDSGTGQLARIFAEVDAELKGLEQRIARGETPPLAETVERAIGLIMGREDALPQAPEKMAVRTARHVFLYVKTRCLREGRLQEAD